MAATQGIAGTAAASETARLAVLTASCCGSLLPAERAALSLRSIALTKNDLDQSLNDLDDLARRVERSCT
jgi:hypothetical protein